MRNIFILNGPNLNLLGQREPEIYGRTTSDEIQSWCRSDAAELGISVDSRQSNFEGEDHRGDSLRPGTGRRDHRQSGRSYLHLDRDPRRLEDVRRPKIELHISNVHQREAIYQKSLVSVTATAVMAGVGDYGYRVALRAMAEMTA